MSHKSEWQYESKYFVKRQVFYFIKATMNMGKKLCLNKEKTIRPKFSIFDPSTSNVGDSLISGSLVKIA